jgi:5'-deoxynucleotidase YfbR-like HD superfamily hydrolase
MKIWTEMDSRLSVVQRWGIARTIQKQSLAEHLVGVERIATRIAREWFGIEDRARLFEISQYALHHDNVEVLTCDLPAMVKPYLDEERLREDHKDLIPWSYTPDEEIRRIVKLADKLEGFHFLCMEVALGNSYMRGHFQAEWGIIETAVKQMWPGDWKIDKYVRDAMGDMAAERSTRYSRRGK